MSNQVEKHIAFIPLRKGSKGIPGKNKKKLLGRPLYCWILSEAIFSKLDEVYVYTDDDEIKSFVRKEYNKEKVIVIDRNSDDASDKSSTEAAMKNFCEKINYQFKTITLLQATSPLTSRGNINEAIDKIETEKCDSVISLVKEKRFIWNERGQSINYDYTKRPRRQDFDGLLVENGAVYTSTKEQFLKSGMRIGGNISYILMPSDTYVEIDEKLDFIIIEELLKRRLVKLKGNPEYIKALVLDVDGVFTDGTVMYNNQGEFSKVFNIRDGMGLEILRENYILPVVITSEENDTVKRRMEKLKIQHVFYGVKDKYYLLSLVLDSLGLNRSEVAYLGDDRNDLANILSCGWGMCPNDSMPEVINNSDIQLTCKGGILAIREAVNFILIYNKRTEK